MIDLIDLFQEIEADLSPAVSGFPVSGRVQPEEQVIDISNISGISGISGRPKYPTEFPAQESAQAGAQARVGMRAKKYPAGSPEMPEMPEKLAGSDGCLSGSLSHFPEKERETGKIDSSAGASPADPAAFDERAAFLEYDCGLSRAKAEAQARAEIDAGRGGRACILSTPSRPISRAAPFGAGPLLREWFAGLSLLSPDVIPCRDYRPDEWAAVLANAWKFLDTFGAQAEALGWKTHELWGVHPTHGTIRVDHCGAVVLAVGGTVRAVTADRIRFERVTYYRRPLAPVGVPIWEASQ